MRHPRARSWEAAASIAAAGAVLAGLRTAAGRPVYSAPTPAAAGVAAGRLVVY
ncbi:MAG: hypothetical protein M3259_02265 [Actinomycetota bacterium]|nr:hypothetical protein [Actinomycetota bacterium]